MARNQCNWATQSGGSVFGRCKRKVSTNNVLVPDTDDDTDTDVVIIEPPESSYWGSSCSRRKRINSSFIIDIDDEDEGAVGDPSSTNYHNFCTTPPVQETVQIRFSSRNKRGLDYVVESSSSESLVSGFSNTGTPDAEDADGDSSDCEILEDTSGSIRKQWEQAAQRRKTSEGIQVDLEDEMSASSSSTVPGTQQHVDVDVTCNAEIGPKATHLEQVEREFLNAKGGYGVNRSFMHTEHEDSPEILERTFEESSYRNHQPQNISFMPPERTNSPKVDPQNSGDVSCHNQEADNTCFIHAVHVNPPEMKQQSFGDASCHDDRPSQNFVSSGVTNVEKGMPSVEPTYCVNNHSTKVSGQIRRECSKQFEEEHLVEPVETSYSGNDAPDTNCLWTPAPVNLSLVTNDNVDVPAGLVDLREKHKESVEYKRAQEEEWASRQKQLQIQAEEVRRLRRRKKAESDMEKRQKQRLEEIRETQRKNEETMNLKEQFRVQVRRELEQMERVHYSMASLLRALGINVGGDLVPSASEVKAGYKRALLTFHPDRVSKNDIHEQVKAEETFKFISRLKEKFLF